MKRIRIIFICTFFVIIAVPIITFNWKENVVSEIDNRELTNNPFGDNYVSDGSTDLTDAIEDYLQDRIGLRDEMITAYTVLNDRLFHEMVHPTYEYGKDGYVFGKTGNNVVFSDYHVQFADMVEKIQTYCEERSIPFVFVFDPSKSTVLQDKLANGINYNAEWVQEFKNVLDEKGINYVDNTDLLKEKTEEGEAVFNQKYNAGHWNDLGAFYGVNNILENLNNFIPTIHINTKDEFDITEKLNETLQVSRFPIHEYEPEFSPKCEITDLTEEFQDEVEIDYQYRTFIYTLNQTRKDEGAPKALVFQGSYMNGMGYKFLENSFGEYIAVHDYQNVTNFDYYYNIFQPDCVIFEVAEYTMTERYFSSDRMKNMDMNPAIDTFSNLPTEEYDLNEDEIVTETGNELTKIRVSAIPEDTEYAYLLIGDKVFDLMKDEEGDGYTVTVENGYWEDGSVQIISISTDNRMRIYD
ncbi:alginate O-acetyltransferase AlgX-related protein [Mediterraneibacter glycyrrhizinilyticus]|uniref:alginate O-acetyltransferase AlgX-related protein n=1 Tax=Mediterraneibacter glycyrrhizinilyticus TaxID=342942 RepID=UPI0025A393DF|nr:hypothetical protein [Mediterraneibacter glycyrrhizinilyticus]MDM8212006.1 hypothetical protein [Mediterraneibacter glycyrrhizinilyticus]